MRRAVAITSACAAVLAAALAAPAAAESPQPITGATGNVFSDSSYTLTGGSQAILQWTGGGPHNVTATALGPDGKSLFRSATIGLGTAPVGGTQYLAPGAYPFECTIHSGMTSTLAVSGGAPLPRPAIAARILSKKRSRVLKSGKLRVAATLTGATAGELEVKLGAKPIATGKVAGGPASLKLSKAGARALAAAGKARLSLRATVDFGATASETAKLK